MTLVKTSLLNGIAVAVKVATVVVLNKILAIYVGPAGYAVMGQFQNFLNMVTAVAGGGVNLGVTKCTAEHFNDVVRQISLWKTAGNIILACSIGTGFIVILLHRPLAAWLFKNEVFSDVFIWFGAGLLMFSVNAFLLAILNGKKDIKRYVTANIAGSIVSLIISGVLAVWWGLYGALVSLAINQSITCIVTLFICRSASWFRLSNLAGRFDPTALRDLGKNSLIVFVSVACIPITQILIRDHLGSTFSWEAAGHWEALMRLSGMYLMLVTTPLSFYILPRVSEIRDNVELRREILNCYAFVLPVVVVGVLIIYVLRDWIILKLFTAEFAPMRDLFAWQLAGDIVKIGGWLMGFVMIGKSMVKELLLTEVVFAFVWFGLVWVFTGWFDVGGAQIGYFITFLLHGCVQAVIVERRTRQLV